MSAPHAPPVPTLFAPSAVWRECAHHRETLRNPWYAAVAELQDVFFRATVDFWSRRGGRTLFLPITTGSISSPMGLGSDSTPVSVDLFGVETYLADSMQFALEYGCRLTGRDCYYVMPSFRGDATDETHLAQFFHSEAEISGTLEDVMLVVQDYLIHVAGALLEDTSDLFVKMGSDLQNLECLAGGACFRALSFDEAAALAGPDEIRVEAGWRTLTRVGERRVIDAVGEFTWVTHWDHLAVPFYQAFDDAEMRRARNADLLFGVGEVAGAGERHKEAAAVAAALDHHGVSADSYAWYSEIRELLPLQTAGFGLGIERFLSGLVSHHDVRDFQLLPRENGRSINP